MSSFAILVELLALIERTFGDPDWERTARMQLHALRMTPGMMAEEYMASFEMLATQTHFNEAALKDTYILSYLISLSYYFPLFYTLISSFQPFSQLCSCFYCVVGSVSQAIFVLLLFHPHLVSI